MAALDDPQRAELRADLTALIRELRALVESARDGSKPVDLDEPIGRLSRMDAIQQQSMAEATRRAAQQRLAQAETLTRQRRPDLWAVYETGEAPEQSDAERTAGKADQDKDEER